MPSGAPPLSFCGQQGQPRRRAARSPFAGAAIRASAWCRPITTGHRDWGCKGNAQLPEITVRISNGGRFLEIAPEQVLEMPPVGHFPPEWLTQICTDAEGAFGVAA